MSEEIVSGSQTETTPTPERDPETEALYSSFDIKPTVEKKEIEFPDLSKGEIPAQTSDESKPPAIEDKPTEPKKLTVKFNKEDVDIDEDKIPEYVQKGLALDKERERKTELEKSLDEAAKLLGLKDHSDFLANREKLVQEQQQKKQDEFEQLKQKVIEDLVYNGVDEKAARAYAENNPLVQQAKSAMEKDQQQEQERQKAEVDQTWQKSWNDLYTAFPDLVDDSKKFENGGKAEFYTPEMESMVNRGLTPKEAYTLLNMDKIQTQSAKKTEQKLIKQQHLGTRSQVEGQAAVEPDSVTLLPEQMALAAEFGVKIEGVKNQQKQLSSRR